MLPNDEAWDGAAPRARWWVVAGVAACWLVMLLTQSTIAEVAFLFPEAVPAQPYFLPRYAHLLYAVVPLGILACIGLLLAPGVLAVLAFGRAHSITDLVLKGFAVAFGLRWVAGVVLTGLAGQAWTPTRFLFVEGCLAVALAVAALWRSAARVPVGEPTQWRTERRRLFWMIGLVVAFVILLLPRIFWLDMNGDAVEIFITGRTLQEFAMPRFPHNYSFVGLQLGIVATAFPVHWFMMLLGTEDFATRLPFLLYTPVLFAVLVELIEFKSARRIRWSEEGLVGLAVLSYGATLAFNGSYNAYVSDIAMPAATDTLAMLCLGATVLFLWRGSMAWLLSVAVLGYFTRPTEVLLLMLLGAGVVFLPRGSRVGWCLKIGAAFAVCWSVEYLYESVYIPAMTGGRLGSYSTGSLLGRFQYLTFSEERRLLHVLLPAGVLPVVALLAFKRQDQWSRTLAFACVGYGALFFVLAFGALYHLAPLMILPIVVWVRLLVAERAFRFALPLSTVTAVIATLLALPTGPEIVRRSREVAARTDNRIGNFLGDYQEYRTSLGSRDVITALFGGAYSGAPSDSFAVDNLPVIYYSTRYPPASERVNYVLQPAGSPAPPEFVLGARVDDAVAYVRDTVAWRNDRKTPPSVRYANPIYWVPMERLHRRVGIAARAYDVNLGALPYLWRFFERRPRRPSPGTRP